MKKTVGVFSLIVMLLSQVFSPFVYAVSGEEVPIPEPVVEEVVPELEVKESEVTEPEVAPEVDNSTGDNNFEVVEPSTGEVADLVEPVDVEVNTGTVISIGEETKNLTEEGTEASSGFIEKITETIKDFLGINGEEERFESHEIYGTGEYEGVKVEVYAQTGLFASGTELTIEPVVEEKLQAVQEVLLSGEVDFLEEQIIAFDITFRDSETQEELQPKGGTVQVKFNYEKNANLVQAEEDEEQEVKVYHLNDKDEEGEKVEEINGAKVEEVMLNEEKSDEENMLVVEANSFSIYTIVTQVAEEGPGAIEDQLANFVYGEISIARPDSLSGEYPDIEGFTVMDRNLGATTNDITSTGSYGYHYQWGNNYGISLGLSSGEVLVPGGIPWKSYYDNSGFYFSGFVGGEGFGYDVWQNGPHEGVWGGAYDSPTNNWGLSGANFTYRQGPCPEGWHVPSAGEWGLLVKYWAVASNVNYEKDNNYIYYNGSSYDASLFNLNGGVSDFLSDFNLPYAGYRSNGLAVTYDVGSNGHYWSSSPYGANSRNDSSFELYFSLTNVNSNYVYVRGNGRSVRCFKDTYSGTGEIHTITFNFNGGSGSTAAINVVDGATGVRPSDPVKSGFVFDGWYSGDNTIAFDFNTAIGDDITLYARWNCDAGYIESNNGNSCVENAVILLPGKDFNEVIKTLAKGSAANYDSYDNSIYYFQRAVEKKAGVETTISIDNSDFPVYAWFENNTLYYYTKAAKIYMNQDSSYMFNYLLNLGSLNLNSFDVSKVTNMSHMFENCIKLSTLSVNGWNTSNVTNMSSMFKNCQRLNVDLNSWNTSSVTDMSYMFSLCYYSTYFGINNWDTHNVINMRSMFSSLEEMSTLDIGGRNTESLLNMDSMFAQTRKLTILDLSGWDTHNVTNMHSVFANSKALKVVDISSWDTRNVTDISNMFYSSPKLKTIYVSGNLYQAPSNQTMFMSSTSLVGGYGTKFNSSNHNSTYAKVDGGVGIPGYFTDPNNFAVAYYTKEETPTLITLEGNKKIGDHPNGLTQSHTTYQYYTGKDETTAVTLNTIDLKAYTELYVNITCDSDDYGLIGTTCYLKHPITVEGSGSTINVTSVVKSKYLSGEQIELTVIGTPDGNITWSSTPSVAITPTNSGHTISFTMPDSNLTLTPTISVYHKVTYHATSNGGNATEDIVREKLVEGDSVDLTLEATKNDYSFEGWNTTQDSHETLSTLTMGTADIDLYPIFKKRISATFSGNGNTIANQQPEVVEKCYRYNVEPTCSVVVPVIDNNAYTSIISGYSMNAATGSEIAEIGTVTLDAATVAGGTASIDISDDITLYAQTYEPEVTYTVTYQKGEGDDARGVIDFAPYNDSCTIAAIYNGNNNVEQATGCEVELPTISIATGYHTPLWYKKGEDITYPNLTITLTGDEILEAKAIANSYTVVYQPGEGTGEMESQEFEYDKEESLNKNKYRKEGYHFSGWIDMLGKEYRDGEKVLNLLTEGVLELTAQWLQNPPAAGGGQSIIPATKEQEHNAAEEKQEEKQESNQDKQIDEQSKTPENTNTSNQTNIQQSSSTSSDNLYKTVVDPEIQSAYEWAYERDVTTIPSLDEAMPDGVVKRGHLAKMVVNYATNVLGREIPEKIPSECRWNDWRKDRESEEIKDYAVKSCALGLMGLDMPKFLPNMEVTRAQFGTIMSRLLWGKKYAGGTPYYRKHLNALKENNIMTQIENPERRVELRQWVWLMLMRSVENK